LMRYQFNGLLNNSMKGGKFFIIKFK
jgi:hypothetical protein